DPEGIVFTGIALAYWASCCGRFGEQSDLSGDPFWHLELGCWPFREVVGWLGSSRLAQQAGEPPGRGCWTSFGSRRRASCCGRFGEQTDLSGSLRSTPGTLSLLTQQRRLLRAA